MKIFGIMASIFFSGQLFAAPLIEKQDAFLDGKVTVGVYVSKVTTDDGSSRNVMVVTEGTAGSLSREDFLKLLPELIQKALDAGMEKLPLVIVRDGKDKQEAITTRLDGSDFKEVSAQAVDVEATKGSGKPAANEAAKGAEEIRP